MKKLLIFLFLGIYHISFSQEKEKFHLDEYKVCVLSDTLRESSGLTIKDNHLYSMNDSGNPSEIYEINSQKCNIAKVIKVKAPNIDWEAITNDGTNFYLGDFGNNQGIRKDLKILKITPDHQFTEIPFYFPEQTSFESANLNNNFDCEAMIYFQGKLHIFTKEWESKAVTHYTIDPENKEKQPAKKIETFPIEYVVTDAAFYNNKLYLVGYRKNMKVYLSIFEMDEKGNFFKERKKFYKLGNTMNLSQIEGIAADDKGLYISGERFKTPISHVAATLYFIPYEKLK